jgi:hypothetical protein
MTSRVFVAFSIEKGMSVAHGAAGSVPVRSDLLTIDC